jgi:membrane-associated phospholipid phosphatase
MVDRTRRSLPARERLVFSLSVAPSAFAVFALLGAANSAGLTRTTDLSVRRRVGPKKSASLTRTASAISLIGAPHMRPVFAGSLAAACRSLGVRNPWRILAASLCATALNRSTRIVLRKKRPPGAGAHNGLDVFAYPSGHCCAVAAMMTSTVRQLSRDRTIGTRAALIGVGAGASLATAWSRLYLDEHWIDDVVGGLCAGVAIGLTITP